MVLDAGDRLDVDRLYEIGLDGDVCEAMRRANPTARVAAPWTSTILWSWLHHRDELHVLLDALSDFGITPREIHESACTRLPYCEVRIGGLLGEAVLHHLGWSHRVVQTTVVTLRASHRGLRTVLAQMTTITAVDYVLALRVPLAEAG